MEIHRCRFVEHVPESVSHMALSPDCSLLAVGRRDAAIEIWNVHRDWIVEKVLPGGEGRSVEALVWGPGGRLFSAGEHARITEWDLVALRERHSVDSHGGAVWSLALNDAGTLLAAACDDGAVRLFAVAEDGGLAYQKALMGDQARILSVAWQPKSHFVVTGSAAGVIRRWNTVSGRPTHRMTVDTVRGEKALVWSVAALEDGTVVSGDSLGHVQFWDGAMGTLLESFSSHTADILSVVAHHRGDSVYAAGVDNQIVQFRYLPEKAKWYMSEKNRAHTHDIKALAISSNSNLLVSGGVDTNLISYSTEKFPKIARETNSYPQRPLITLSHERKLLCCQFPQKIEIWSLGSSYSHDGIADMATGAALTLSKAESKLLELTSKAGGNITCSAISNDGNWLAFSNARDAKLFSLQMKEEKLAVSKLAQASRVIRPAHALLFTPDSSLLLAVAHDRTVTAVSLPELEVKGSFSWADSLAQHGLANIASTASVRTHAVSADGLFLALGDTNNQIQIVDLQTFKLHCLLPVFHTPHTALAFVPERALLVVAYSSFEYQVFDLNTKTLSKEFAAQKIPYPTTKDRKNKVMGVVFHPRNPLRVLFYGLTYISPVDLGAAAQAVVPATAVARQTKKSKTAAPSASAGQGAGKEKGRGKGKGKGKGGEHGEAADMDVDQTASASPEKAKQAEAPAAAAADEERSPINTRYSPMLFFDCLDGGSFVVVERPWLSIIRKFPAPLYRPRYGT